MKLAWQSKLVLLLVLPFAAASLVLETRWWGVNSWPVAVWTLGISFLLGLVVLELRAATPGGAFAGFAITACMMFSTAAVPYQPWHTALVPVLAVSVLAHLATRLGREKKERLGAAEGRRGRSASQVAANLGIAALASGELSQSWLADTGWFPSLPATPMLLFSAGLAALAEAAADTVSSEVGQVAGGRPRLITSLRKVDPGTDGAVSLTGTLAGIAAAILVAAAGTMAVRGNFSMAWTSCLGGVSGLFADSLLGATLERRGWLGNDAVNFLSTACAACISLGLLALSRSF